MAIEIGDVPAIMDTGWGPMLVNVPEGYCPWGEAKCDDKCAPQHGCKLDRPREPVDITHGHHGAHQDFTGFLLDEVTD